MTTLVKVPETQVEIQIKLLVNLVDAGISDDAKLAMRDIDTEHVSHLVESNPEEWDPITITRTSVGDVVIDGYHRLAAAKALKRTHIKAIYASYYDAKEVIDAAFKANLRHGLPANSTTRYFYAIWLMTTYKVSQRQAAKQAGVDPGNFNKFLKKLQDEKEGVQGDSEDQTSYNSHQINYTKKLVKALQDFYENETAFFKSKGSQRSEEKRAKSLAGIVAKKDDSVQILRSMSKTFNLAAILVEQSISKQK